MTRPSFSKTCPLAAGLALALCACAARPAAERPQATSIAAGGESPVAAAVAAESTGRCEQAERRAHVDDPVVIEVGTGRTLREHPAAGTLVQISPPTASLPGLW